jgi:hypothetical protein
MQEPEHWTCGVSVNAGLVLHMHGEHLRNVTLHMQAWVRADPIDGIQAELHKCSARDTLQHSC